MEFSASLPGTYERVEALLKQPNSDKLKSSDPLLILAYLNRFHDLGSKLGDRAFMVLRDILMDPTVPKFESITRIRRRLQQEGQFEAITRSERRKQAVKVKEITR